MSNVSNQENQRKIIIGEAILISIIQTLEKMPFKEVEAVLVPLKHVPGTLQDLAEYDKTRDEKKLQEEKAKEEVELIGTKVKEEVKEATVVPFKK